MEKKKYISPAIKVYNITPNVILAGSIQMASDYDYNSLSDGEYYGDWHHSRHMQATKQVEITFNCQIKEEANRVVSSFFFVSVPPLWAYFSASILFLSVLYHFLRVVADLRSIYYWCHFWVHFSCYWCPLFVIWCPLLGVGCPLYVFWCPLTVHSFPYHIFLP